MEETTTATIEEAPSDFSIVKAVAGENSTIGLILVIVLVVGGKAGWNFWNKLLEKKHAEKMKALEIEAAKVEKGAKRKGKR
jgi:predicted negative regulator of RcsB-dependent stress response